MWVVNESAKTSIKSRVPLEEHTISRIKDIEFIAFVVIDSPLNVLVLHVLFWGVVRVASVGRYRHWHKGYKETCLLHVVCNTAHYLKSFFYR